MVGAHKTVTPKRAKGCKVLITAVDVADDTTSDEEVDVR
jgi:hypothetical protein